MPYQWDFNKAFGLGRSGSLGRTFVQRVGGGGKAHDTFTTLLEELPHSFGVQSGVIRCYRPLKGPEVEVQPVFPGPFSNTRSAWSSLSVNFSTSLLGLALYLSSPYTAILSQFEHCVQDHVMLSRDFLYAHPCLHLLYCVNHALFLHRCCRA